MAAGGGHDRDQSLSRDQKITESTEVKFQRGVLLIGNIQNARGCSSLTNWLAHRSGTEWYRMIQKWYRMIQYGTEWVKLSGIVAVMVRLRRVIVAKFNRLQDPITQL